MFLHQRRLSFKNAVVLVTAAFVFFSCNAIASQNASGKSYEELLSALRAEQSGPQDRVAASWKMGKLMEDDAAAHSLWAGYREEINKRLAADLGLRENDIRDLRQFARVYPEPPSPELGWAHYVILIYVHPDEKREALQEQAMREHWPRETLRLEVNRLLAAEIKTPKTEPLSFSAPGKLNTYRVVKAEDGVNAGRLVLDLGFGIQQLVPENTALKEGNLVNDSFQPVSSEPEALHTYSARVTKIKDGDTFEATVDLGFGLSVSQTFRLKGVDAPELGGSLRHGMSESRQQAPGSPETGEGLTAKTFVYHEITRAEGRVVLRAGEPDKYRRILAVVWVGNECLNQKLVDAGMAVKAEEGVPSLRNDAGI